MFNALFSAHSLLSWALFVVLAILIKPISAFTCKKLSEYINTIESGIYDKERVISGLITECNSLYLQNVETKKELDSMIEKNKKSFQEKTALEISKIEEQYNKKKKDIDSAIEKHYQMVLYSVYTDYVDVFCESFKKHSHDSNQISDNKINDSILNEFNK
ncbi:MAG: hypothetical protein P857_1021 [Candidatus Xenolissoclinum pacificiensis L6]|uniref:Uncharacterized protein n=1 Tax=Candidatus Xenolissoclinum pacificiensis L6 TaxID=1401685 RepID=W2V313_9RICK|nr:MAG: hypothetical protein P857_1021 [Candidatus Xenolissoclinum pacificiensis L6]